jgi:hypothetical protein
MIHLPDFNTLVNQITQWGKDRNIIGEGKAKDQYLKLMEEFGEILEAKVNSDIKDAIGDSMVVLIMLAGIEGLTIAKQHVSLEKGWSVLTKNSFIALSKLAQAIAKDDKPVLQDLLDDLVAILTMWATGHLMDIEECMDTAYQVIKHRKGVLFDGVFVKSDDPTYVEVLAKLRNK